MPRLQNFAGARYSGWSNWKVWHDLVKAHPSGDCIFCFLFLFCFVFLNSFVDHDPPTAFENWRCGASHCKLCKKRINFPSNYKLPNSKGKTTMCVWFKPNISEKANNSGQICSLSSRLISVDCLFLQKNTDLSEDTQYRYRPVNLLLEPYFLPRPVRFWWWWTMQ